LQFESVRLIKITDNCLLPPSSQSKAGCTHGIIKVLYFITFRWQNKSVAIAISINTELSRNRAPEGSRNRIQITSLDPSMLLRFLQIFP